MDRVFTPVAFFPLNRGQWVNVTQRLIFLFRDGFSPLEAQIPLPVGVLFEQLCHSSSDSGRQTIVQMDKWTCPYMHRCRSGDVHASFPTCFSHSMSNLSLVLLFFPSVSPVTKGVFLFKGPQKPLGTQSRNCYNWWRRGEAFGTRKSRILIMLAWDRSLYCFRAQKDTAGKTAFMNSHNMLSAALWYVYSVTFVKGFTLFCSCGLAFTCKLVSWCAYSKWRSSFFM